MTCQGCGDVAPTRKVHFGRNVGMLFMRRVFEVEGLLCRRCIEERFWEFNGKLLLLGWWGTISFFATWYYLIANLFTYLRSLTLDSNVDGLWKTAFGWKLTNFAVIWFVALVIGVTIDANRPGITMMPHLLPVQWQRQLPPGRNSNFHLRATGCWTNAQVIIHTHFRLHELAGGDPGV